MIKMAPITPNAKKINYSRFAAPAKLGMRDAAEAAQADMEKTTAAWRHKPEWVVKEQKDGYLVGTNDDVWNMLDKGTPKHVIRAKRGRVLRFGSGFAPKTRPGFVGSTAGTKASGAVFRRQVNHPGTAARSWSKLIAAKYRVQLQRYISARIKEAM
jgi:hypothetical protein